MSQEQDKKTQSEVERIKLESNYLRGTISQDLEDGLTGGFTSDNYQLIRIHGMYEQDDRDIRAERLQQKLEPRRAMMLRCRLPGGIISPAQWIAIDEFASEHTFYNSVRLTNRQTFQFHGVLKKDLRSMHQLLNRINLDSIATAGDVNRNVVCTSNPVESSLHEEAYEWAKKISEHLLPKTRAYAEIWLDGEKVVSSEEQFADVEPILGKQYLPRKFKTAVVIPPQNDVDLHANDLNFVAIAEKGKLVGFNVLVGGGLSMEHGNHNTYPNIAKELGFVPLEKTLDAAAAVVMTQRDFGNRSDRKNARVRYTVQRMGVATFREEVEKRMGAKFSETRPYHFTDRGDRIGWVEDKNGKWHLTLFIENGRFVDKENSPIKSGMLAIAKVHKGDFRITANQNMIIANVPVEEKETINQLVRKYGLVSDKTTLLRESSMACVSLPTCPLAMAEAERVLPDFINQVDSVMAKHGVANKEIVLRITGCPNGCGRAMLAEIGLVGKAVGRYNLHLGGNREGTRIPRLYKENIQMDEILTIIDELVALWAKNAAGDECFGDFLIRSDVIKPVVDAAVDFYDESKIIALA